MRNMIVVLVIAAFLQVAFAEIKTDEGVLVLTDANFDEAITQHNFLFVKMYAPWCGHCQKMAPEMVKAAATLAKENPPLYVSKIDCTVHKDTCSKYGANGYPTLKFFVNGQPTEYEGGRKDTEIVNWIKKKTGPAAEVMNAPSELDAFIGKNPVVGVFFGPKTAQTYPAFEGTARSLDKVAFAECSSQDCYNHYRVREGQFTLFKNFDEKRNDIHENFSTKILTSFIKRNMHPLVSSFNDEIAEFVFGQNNPAIFIYRDKKDAGIYQTFAQSLGSKLNGKLRVITSGIKDGVETRLADYIGVEEKDLPCIKIADTRGRLKKYNMEGDINEENVLQFVADWEAGKLKPFLKSENVPEKNEGDVKVIVGKNFKDVVINSTQDVLMEFYAPWCGHCKKLAPIWDELATKVKKLNPNVIIAKMDSTKNEVEEVSVSGYPSIYYFPAGEKNKPQKYSGERDLNGFIAFLEKNVKGFKKEEL